MILSLFGFLDFTIGRLVLSCRALCVRVRSVLLSTAITSPGEERAGPCASRAFVFVSCTRLFLSVFYSCWGRGYIAACD